MQIPHDKRVRQYELTYLISPQLTSDETREIAAVVEKSIKKFDGKVLSQEDWGKRSLAYTLKHLGKRYDEAVFKHLVIEFETKAAFEFEKDVHLNQQILRYLFVIAEEAKKA